MKFTRHLDRLAAAIAWLAGLLPRATAAPRKPMLKRSDPGAVLSNEGLGVTLVNDAQP
jgi:hypothetical protein